MSDKEHEAKAAQEAAAAKEAEAQAAESKEKEEEGNGIDHKAEVEALKEKLGKTEKKLGQAEYKLDKKNADDAKRKAEEDEGSDPNAIKSEIQADLDKKLEEMRIGLTSNVVDDEIAKLGESDDEREHIKLIYQSTFANSVGTDRASIVEAVSNAHLIANKSRVMNNLKEAQEAQSSAGKVESRGTINADEGIAEKPDEKKLAATSKKYTDTLPKGYRD